MLLPEDTGRPRDTWLSYRSGRPRRPPEMHKLSQMLLISCDCDFGKLTQPSIALGEESQRRITRNTLPSEYACEGFS